MTNKKEAKSKSSPFQSVKGIYEIMPEESPWWEKLYSQVRDVAQFYNFKRIETGIIENADLFVRAVGEETDIVGKEMFFIKSRKDKWVLRPEATASVARAYLQYGFSRLTQPVRLYYFGPMFRHENPQSGRYRQFHQTGFEIVGGDNDPIFDAQAILIAMRILRGLGFKDSVIELNSIGCRVCQPNIKKKLVNYYKTKQKDICKDCQVRIQKNPLRVLDCKVEGCQEVKKHAPVLLDGVCVTCRNHFKNLLEYLDEVGVAYELNNNLVRGLDYYNRTVFEIFIPSAESSRLAVGGGGRYDYLVEMIGGRATPAVGFSLGLERLVAVMKDKKGEINSRNKKRVFFIHVGEIAKKKSLPLIEELRENAVTVVESLSKETLARQLAQADKQGVEVVIIFGQREVYEENVIIKNLKTGLQETVAQKKMIDEVKKRFT